MKQIHVWPNHIRIPHLDLVLVRPADEPLHRSLNTLARLGFDTRPENIELHGAAPTGSETSWSSRTSHEGGRAS
jgi:hypothetical protein